MRTARVTALVFAGVGDSNFGFASDSSVDCVISSEHWLNTSAHLSGSSAHLGGSSAHSAGDGSRQSTSGRGKVRDQRNVDSQLVTDQLDAPVVDALLRLTPEFVAHLTEIAGAFQTRGRMTPDAMPEALIRIWTGRYVALDFLSTLVARDSDALSQQNLTPLTNKEELQIAFPTAPTHTRQPYRSAE